MTLGEALYGRARETGATAFGPMSATWDELPEYVKARWELCASRYMADSLRPEHIDACMVRAEERARIVAQIRKMAREDDWPTSYRTAMFQAAERVEAGRT